MMHRRTLLGASISLPVAYAASHGFGRRAVASTGAMDIAAELAAHPGDPEAIAQDEAYWSHVARAFTVDRSIINLNNGGISPSPAIVQEAMKRHLDHTNSTPPPIALWRTYPPQREAVRQQLARTFGCDAEEVAITRNASESLQICQFGLNLKPGDEVLTTNQDYPRMLSTFLQRERREGIALRTISIPVPAEDPAEVVRRFERAITPRTRVILACHTINLTGQILPIKALADMAHAHGIPIIVDGAHALAHFPFRIDELGCDYYGTSLHKWLFAPHGTGLLYVSRPNIHSLWPLMAAEASQEGNIRKFEEIGTHPAANFLAIAEAITFHLGIGPERKAARLVYLRDTWARRLTSSDRFQLLTSLKPGFGCGLATINLLGVDPAALVEHLWQEHRILTTAIKHDEFQGIRVTPSVYTTPAELERFCDAMEHVAAHGLPA